MLRDGGLVKTRAFRNGVYVGDPINAIRIFNDKEVDELVLLDIGATRDKRAPDFDLIAEIAGECFMPLAYGGGVSKLEHIHRLLRLGVEKVVINTAIHTDPALVREAVAIFGSQAIIASIDVKRKLLGRREVLIASGTQGTGCDPLAYALEVQKLGVGEILLTSIDNEGSMAGYDLPLLQEVSKAIGIPVIASGGAGSIEHFRQAVQQGGVSAVSAGSMFVFYGKHRAVLISYPDYSALENALAEG
jgi:imidazole glycerol-phosphate synthase subunit HisF